MSKTWKYKFFLVIGSIVIGLYLLIPTIFKTNQIKEEIIATGAPLPWYFNLLPEKALNLGLDLRGGIYIEMAVDIKSAIKRKADLLAGDMELNLKEKGVEVDMIDQPAGDGTLHVRVKNNADIDVLRGVISDYYPDYFAILNTTVEKDLPTLIVTFNDKYRSYISTKVADQALETIRNRIDRYGVAEPTITKQGSDRISIEIPGITDPDRAINIIKKTGQLEFKLVDESVKQPEIVSLVEEAKTAEKLPDNYTEATTLKLNEYLKGKLPEGDEIAFEIQRDPTTRKILKGSPYLLKSKAQVTGDMLQSAQVSVHDNEPYVDLALDKTGTKLFGQLTSENVGKRLAIVLDGTVMKAPVIKDAIMQGRAQITLGYGNYHEQIKEAEDLTLVLQEGALPASLTEATKTIVGPSLGLDSINKGIKASLIAAIIVIIFMIVYYKLSGLWANIAMVVNVLLILAILAAFQATLTLPGIAGIVLTIGMAVDANVIINERIREELALGKTPMAAIDSGYAHALSAVIDANITTLIAGIVLYQFGTGPIRGFAVTLSVGILTTLFTAIIITRLIFDYRVIHKKASRISI